MILGVLDRYLGKTVLRSVITTLFMLVSLSCVIKFIDQLRSAGKGAYTVWGGAYYTFLSIPKDIEIFMPMAILLGSLLGLGRLAQQNELVVMQASGLSRLRITFSVMKTLLPLILAVMAMGEFLAPNWENQARIYRSQHIFGGNILVDRQGLWAKDGRRFVYISRVRGNHQLDEVNIYDFNEAYRLVRVIYAANAWWDEKKQHWMLSQVDESDLSNPKKIVGKQRMNVEWKSMLTPDKLNVVSLDPNALSIRGLYSYAHYLTQSGQSAERYQLNMWRKIFYPLSALVLLMVAFSFIFGPLRHVSMGIRLLTGISLGFLFYVLDQTFGPLSLVYGFPPLLGALLPAIIFFVMSVGILVKRH